jgi:hypothetical protein
MRIEAPELTFLRYAFPVIGHCTDIKVDPEEIKYFENALKTGAPIQRRRLEQLFPNGTKRLASWTQEAIRDYWLNQHSDIEINNPLCQIYRGEITKISPPYGNELNRAKVSGLAKIDVKTYIPLKLKDKVSMHYFVVAEKLDP